MDLKLALRARAARLHSERQRSHIARRSRSRSRRDRGALDVARSCAERVLDARRVCQVLPGRGRQEHVRALGLQGARQEALDRHN